MLFAKWGQSSLNLHQRDIPHWKFADYSPDPDPDPDPDPEPRCASDTRLLGITSRALMEGINMEKSSQGCYKAMQLSQ